MFKKTQNYLLLHHPLLWNLKIVPVIAITIALHIIFFITGYVDGAIDFTRMHGSYYYDITPTVATFFSIITGLFLTIIWIVYYFRNNGFKAFYPKSNTALYKEWLIILLVCLLNCTYSLNFIFARDLRKRTYFSEQEFAKRLDILSMASVFADGGFIEDEYYQVFDKVKDTSITYHRTTYPYFGKEYPLKSLLNKSNSSFSYQSRVKDSLNSVRVKGWLHLQQKDSVLWLMAQVDKIAKAHRLKTNMTPAEWAANVYNPPLYTDYKYVGRVEYYELDNYQRPTQNRYNYEYDYTEAVDAEQTPIEEVIDTTNTKDYYIYTNISGQKDYISLKENYIKHKGKSIYVYPKFYVPLSQLEESYGGISEAYTNPGADGELVFIYFIFSFMMSLAIFSFRVTSGRSWLIALVGFGLTALITGILSIILTEFSLLGSYIGRLEEYLFFIIWILIVSVLFILFYRNKSKKGISGVYTNILLWLSPWLLPVTVLTINRLVIKYYRLNSYNYNHIDYQYDSTESYMQAHYPIAYFIRENPFAILVGGLVLFIGYMYFFTNSIRKWKGIAES